MIFTNFIFRVSYCTIGLLLLKSFTLQANQIKGIVVSEVDGTSVPYALVMTEIDTSLTGTDGAFVIKNNATKNCLLKVISTGYMAWEKEIELLDEHIDIGTIRLQPLSHTITTVEISARQNLERKQLSPIQGTLIAAGKKNDVVLPANTDANLAQNNARQLFARVPGLVIWENDGNGTGISIGARGLSPNRSWEFNNRQNGYDMSSDAFGYPEAYYIPPAQALQRIEIIRGAAGLQFGPQLGGLVNYVLREGARDRKVEGTLNLSGGAFGMGNAFADLGGTSGKLNYYGFYNYRRADGWRENSSYATNTGYVNVNMDMSSRLRIGMQFTGMYYLLQQPGGLTDSLFNIDARQSLRERNWFAVRWNMPAITVDYTFRDEAKLGVKAFGLMGERNSVGYTGAANTLDPNTQRTVDRDYYTNYGIEARYLRPVKWLKRNTYLAGGLRWYKGNTQRKQGKGSAGSDADFTFADPNILTRNLDLNAQNAAAFIELLIEPLQNLKLVPGIRYEFIRSSAEGIPALRQETRSEQVPLLGCGFEYALPFNLTAYGNWSQAFRPVTFNELWTNLPSVEIDENLRSVRAQNMDLGVRGSIRNYIQYDINVFLLLIDGRVGDLALVDETGNDYLLRTNVGNSKNSGMEWYVDFHPLRFIKNENKMGDISLFVSGSYLEAWYTAGTTQGKRVEYAPRWNLRTGITYKYNWISATLNWSFMDKVYTDARNSNVNSAGTTGALNAYQLWDAGLTITLPRNIVLKGGLNNIANVRYATRRANGYPGPGIIPGDGRSGVIGVGMRF